MHLVDDRFIQPSQRRSVVIPVEMGADDHAFGHSPGIILLTYRRVLIRIAELVGKDRSFPVHLSGNSLNIRIQNQLARVEPETALRIVWAVNTIPIKLSGLNAHQINVPDATRALR